MIDEQLTLFAPQAAEVTSERGGSPVGLAPATEAETQLGASLPNHVRLGTSSWSSPGWQGILWDRPVSGRVLAREGLKAYARHPLLRTVGLDRTYYRSIPAAEFRRLADQVLEDFRFLVKADRLITSPLMPGPGRVRGANPDFLNVRYAVENVVRPMEEGLRDKAGPLLFQFSPLRPNLVGGRDAFIERLATFLASLPVGPLYAVELRTPSFLTGKYASMLREMGVAHCFNVHPAMSSLAEQLRVVRPYEQPAVVMRWMLGGGRDFEAARERYAPFDRIVDPDERSLDQLAVAALDGLIAERDIFVIADNKAEGSAPLSVARLARRIVAWDGGTRSVPSADGPTRQPAVTLRWIVDLLSRAGVPFQAVGNLASRAWGATGALEHLDLHVSRAGLEAVLPDLEPWVARPLQYTEGTDWRGTWLRIEHHGTRLDLGVADDAMIRDVGTGEWIALPVDFSASVAREVMGMPIPVIPRDRLLSYKRARDRETDRRDVRDIEAATSLPEVAEL